MNRRSWLKTTAGLLLAPAVVRAESLMPVRQLIVPTYVLEVFGTNGLAHRTMIDPAKPGRYDRTFMEIDRYRVRIRRVNGSEMAWVRDDGLNLGNTIRVDWPGVHA